MTKITKIDDETAEEENTTTIKHFYKKEWLVAEITRLQAILDAINK